MPRSESDIRRAIESCPRLGSLRRINSTFHELVNADQDFTGQIAEIIRRDPSLTSRLLQMVNSVFFGLAETVNSVQDAVFYLGTKQIRQMALATPVLEDMQQFTDKAPDVDWQSFWRQSIGCAIMTRELLSFSDQPTRGDSDYISGLIHGVGHLVSFYTFTGEMLSIRKEAPQTEEEMITLQREIIGWDHMQIAAHYLATHNVPPDITQPIRFQEDPLHAAEYRSFASALYVAKRMVGSSLQGRSSDDPEPSTGPFQIPLPRQPDWESCRELHSVFNPDSDANAFTLSSLRYAVNQLPDLLKGLV